MNTLFLFPRYIFKCFLIISFLYTGAGAAPPFTSKAWTGTDEEILNQAMSEFTDTAKTRIREQFVSKEGDISLEKKLWILIDHLVEDKRLNYSREHFLSTFTTVQSKYGASSYTADQARFILRKVSESLTQLLPTEPKNENAIKVYRKDKLTKKTIETTKYEINKQRNLGFLSDLLEGSVNIIVQQLKPRDLELFSTYKKSKYLEDTSIPLTADLFETVLKEKLNAQKTGNKNKPVSDQNRTALSVIESRMAIIKKLPVAGQEHIDRLRIKLKDRITSKGPIADLHLMQRLAPFDMAVRRTRANHLSSLMELNKVWKMKISGERLNDIGMLKWLINIKYLDASSNYLTDIKVLKNCPQLEFLDLSDNTISSLEGLANCKQLVELRIFRSELKSLRGIETLNSIKRLGLIGNELQDVTALMGLKNLKSLTLTGNPKIPADQIAALKKALPKCQIYHD